MYLHGQIPESQGLSQIEGGGSECLNWRSSVRPTGALAACGGSVCVSESVCVASGLPGPADCTHCTATLPVLCSSTRINHHHHNNKMVHIFLAVLIEICFFITAKLLVRSIC